MLHKPEEVKGYNGTWNIREVDNKKIKDNKEVVLHSLPNSNNLSREETHCVKENIITKTCEKQANIENPPSKASELIRLPVMEPEEFQESLSRDEIEQVYVITREADDTMNTEHLLSTSTLDPEVLDEKTRLERFESQGWD